MAGGNFNDLANSAVAVDVTSARKLNDPLISGTGAFLPKDLQDAVKGLTDQVKTDVGWKGTQYDGEMGGIAGEVGITEMLYSKDGLRGDGKLTSATERQMDRLGRGVSKLSDKAAREAERVGKAYGRFVDGMAKELQKFKDNLGNAIQKAEKTATTKFGSAGASNIAEETLATIGGEAIKLKYTTSGTVFDITVGSQAHSVTTFTEAQEKIREGLKELAEKHTRQRLDSVMRVNEILSEHLGDVKGAIAEFRTDNLSKLEAVLGRPVGQKVEAAITHAPHVPAGTHGEGVSLMEHAPKRGVPVVGMLVGAGLGAAAVKVLKSDPNNQPTAMDYAIGTGGGAAVGGIAQFMMRARSTAMGVASHAASFVDHVGPAATRALTHGL